MFKEEREEKILEVLKKKRKIEVDDLSNMFSVSKATVRKDLNKLKEKIEGLERTYGGAILREKHTDDIGELKERKKMNKKKKEKIGKKTCSFIGKGSTIMIDAGTTTLEVVKNLKDDLNLTIISNSLEICYFLSKTKDFKVVSIGGVINQKNLSMRGKLGIKLLSEYSADQSIIGVEGISEKFGLTVSNELVARIKKRMIAESDKVIIVSDSSKIGRVRMSKFADLSEIDKLIMDDQVSEDFQEFLEKFNVKLIKV